MVKLTHNHASAIRGLSCENEHGTYRFVGSKVEGQKAISDLEQYGIVGHMTMTKNRAGLDLAIIDYHPMPMLV